MSFSSLGRVGAQPTSPANPGLQRSSGPHHGCCRRVTDDGKARQPTSPDSHTPGSTSGPDHDGLVRSMAGSSAPLTGMAGARSPTASGFAPAPASWARAAATRGGPKRGRSNDRAAAGAARRRRGRCSGTGRGCRTSPDTSRSRPRPRPGRAASGGPSRGPSTAPLSSRRAEIRQAAAGGARPDVVERRAVEQQHHDARPWRRAERRRHRRRHAAAPSRDDRPGRAPRSAAPASR